MGLQKLYENIQLLNKTEEEKQISTHEKAIQEIQREHKLSFDQILNSNQNFQNEINQLEIDFKQKEKFLNSISVNHINISLHQNSIFQQYQKQVVSQNEQFLEEHKKIKKILMISFFIIKMKLNSKLEIFNFKKNSSSIF